MFRLIVVSLLAIIPSRVSGVGVNVTLTCNSLKEQLPSEVILPGDPQYQNVSDKNWTPVARRDPTCILIANTTKTLEIAVQRVVADQVPFAIRSGGHMIKPGAANIDNGILIDLSRFSVIEYVESEGVVRVGSGARWGDVYQALEPYNVTAVGGRLNDIGVGGLILGGGLSWLSPKYGLACDNVVNFEVILANGTLINANASSSNDLFKALKGGSNNFGIVTRFTINTYPIELVWGGIRVYAPNQLPALVSAFAEYQMAPEDPNASIMIQAPLTNASYGVLLNLAYTRPVKDPSAFDVFKHIPVTVDETSIRSYSSLIAGASDPNINLLPRWDWRTATLALNSTLYTELLNMTTSSPGFQNIAKLTSGTFVFNLQPISPGVVQQGRLRGGNSLGISDEPQLWLQYLCAWWDEKDDYRAHSSTKAILDRIEQAAEQSSDLLEFQYMNDASWDQNVMAHYGSESVSFLKEVQASYDPTHVFQSLVKGGFKLPM